MCVDTYNEQVLTVWRYKIVILLDKVVGVGRSVYGLRSSVLRTLLLNQFYGAEWYMAHGGCPSGGCRYQVGGQRVGFLDKVVCYRAAE